MRNGQSCYKINPDYNKQWSTWFKIKMQMYIFFMPKIFVKKDILLLYIDKIIRKKNYIFTK